MVFTYEGVGFFSVAAVAFILMPIVGWQVPI
jgi:hypothetical protein